jgi:hypothetical protein
VKARLEPGSPRKILNTRFELLGVSTQPGIAMNYPRIGGYTPDLAFLDAGAMAGQVWQASGPEPDAVIGSFDFGAWGTLRVTASLDDGTEISHSFNGSDENIPIPFRARGSLIAVSWKFAALGPDSLDDENKPFGNGFAGDGLTLYEEYRGFIESKEHIEGDPTVKDLFIINFIQAETATGIAKFAKATGLAVHGRLADDEHDGRVINLNYTESAPHAVDQHGIILRSNPGVRGAFTLPETNEFGPPRLTSQIVLEPLLLPFGQSALQAPVLETIYDHAVGHELLHAVGVPHHGELDTLWFVILEWPINNNSPKLFITPYKPASPDITHRIELLSESQPSLNLAPSLAAVFSPLVSRLEDFPPANVLSPARGKILFPVRVGEFGGHGSGSDQCLMRYPYARWFPNRSKPSLQSYFQVTSQPLGFEICQRPAGTGVNGPDRQPQPRHGDATHGACASKIVVNDLAPSKRY